MLLVLAALPPELKPVEEHFKTTPSVTAHFVQKRRWAALKDVLESSGTVTFGKDGRILWRTEKPNLSELEMDGSKATMRAPKLGTSQSFDLKADPGMAAVFESLAAVMKADFTAIDKLYDLKLTSKSPVAVELKPKNAGLASVLAKISLKFDAKSELQQVVLDEAGGDSTEIAFSGHVVPDAGR
jgi:outer membrane lipoprotein-sorting protein